MDCVIASIIVPHTSFRDGTPLRFCAIVVYACQATATRERTIAYRRDTVRYCCTCQAAATIERISSYRGDTSVSRYHTGFTTQNQCFACGFDNTIPLAVVFSITYSNFDVCQTAATNERIIPYRRDAVWNLYAYQTATTTERIRAYRRDAAVSRYHTVFATQNQCFACGFDNTIPLTVVFSITYSNFDVCQIVATTERIITYRRDAVRYCYTCQATAIAECSLAYRRDTIWDCYACQAATTIERTRAYRRDTVWYCYTCQTTAILEHMPVYRRDTVRYYYTCQTDATAERAEAYRSYTVRDCYVCKSDATAERAEAYRSYAVWDGYASQVAATTERTRAYRRDAIWKHKVSFHFVSVDMQSARAPHYFCKSAYFAPPLNIPHIVNVN